MNRSLRFLLSVSLIVLFAAFLTACGDSGGGDSSSSGTADLMEGAIPPPDIIPETTTIQYVTEDGTQVDIEAIKGQVIVLFDSTVSENTAENLIVDNGGNIIAKIPATGFYLVSVTPGNEMNFISKLRQEPTVTFAMPDVPIEPFQLEPDEWEGKDYYFSWQLKEINAPLAWELINNFALDSTEIGIVDRSFNGFNIENEDFKGRILGTTPIQLPWPFAPEGHGTKVTAVATATGNNAGNVGLNWQSKIRLERVYTLFDTSYQILSVVNKGADVINVSLGVSTCDGMMTLFLNPLFLHLNSVRLLFPSKKFLVVQAAGNDSCELIPTPFTPYKPDNLILVGATEYGGDRLSDSNFGSLIDIAAPGAFSILYYSTGAIVVESGTSFAAPLVTGAAALVWAKEPNLTPKELIQSLKNTAQPFRGNYPSGKFGAGILDVYKALGGTETIPNTPPTASIVSPADGSSFYPEDTISFQGSGTDSDGYIASYAWDFGDGTTNTQQNPTHTYADTGTYTVMLSVTDNGGATGSASVSISIGSPVDTEPPTIPTGLTATAVSSSQINILWDASTDDTGVTGYNIYRDGAFLKPVAGTSISDTGLISSTQYCYQISAYDAAENESGQSTEACATTQSVEIILQPGPGEGKDIWTTSVYSYAPDGGGPGGGLDNEWLEMGGWGDLYYILIEFDLTGLPPVALSARIELFVGKSKGYGNTGVYLDRITEFWDWRIQGTGADLERLWWADRPSATQWIPSSLPAPTVGQWYSIDITDLYNAWQDGTYLNYGVQLRPVSNNNRWNEFYSSDYIDNPSLRPKLVVIP